MNAILSAIFGHYAFSVADQITISQQSKNAILAVTFGRYAFSIADRIDTFQQLSPSTAKIAIQAGHYAFSIADQIAVSQQIVSAYRLTVQSGNYATVGAASINDMQSPSPPVVAVKGPYVVKGRAVAFVVRRRKPHRNSGR